MKSTTTSTVSTTFTFNGTVYTANGTKNHCYRWPEGLKGERVRINKAEFEAAEDQYNAECKARIEKAAEKAVEEQDAQQELVAELNAAVEKKAAPKTKKSTKKAAKTIAADDKLVTLTEKQVDFIKHLPNTCFWEDGLDSTPWTDVLCDEIGGQFAGKPMTTGAMISTLCEKGLAYRGKGRVNKKTCTYMGLTDLGKLVAYELGLR